ncbi:MAG: hypothetical protein ABR499_08140 [Gemmatimonadaceae bacterium]
MSRTLLVAIVAAVAACGAPTTRQPQQQPQEQREPPAPPAPPAPIAATLVTDSAQYTVRFVNGMYRARIGYRYTNQSGDAVSVAYCRTPPPPLLEKKVGGEWVQAYSAVVLLCRSIPDFRIPAGGTYRGALDLAAAPRGRNEVPILEVDSVPGTYRLRWELRAGNDPDVGAVVEAISNEFRLVER